MSSTIKRIVLRSLLCLAAAAGIAIAVDDGIAPAQAAPLEVARVAAARDGWTRLPGHVVPALAGARIAEYPRLPAAQAANTPVTLTVVLKRADQAGFERYLQEVYDPASRNYRHFLTQEQIAQRFGPSPQSYALLTQYMQNNGFEVTQGSANRMTVTVRGTRAAIERAFRVRINDYEIGGTSFYANDSDPALPEELASRVQAIDGLSSLSAPQPVIQKIICGPPNKKGKYSKSQQVCRAQVQAGLVGTKYILCNTIPALSGGAINPYIKGGGILVQIICDTIALSVDLINASKAPGKSAQPNAALDRVPDGIRAVVDGSGQKIGLLEFDAFNMSDVSDYLALFNAPAAQIGNLSVVPVNGGVATPGSGETEVLLDIDTIETVAPGAKIAVYEAPFTGQAANYTSLFNAMINDGVTVISNSWASCEDQVSQSEAQSIDTILQTAAASGISVFNGSGDTGSTCLDGSANIISVPADSPSATAVGGSSWPSGFGPGFTHGQETWWDGSAESPPTGQGGFGVSKYFSRPSYQSSVSAGAMRSIPDVVVRADPYDGVVICQADDGGCPNGSLNGGTSLATPEWAAFAALINQAQGKNLGAFNPLLYPMAASAAFNNASSMGSDFAHVGLGSPNLNVINRLLNGGTVGAVNVALSSVTPLVQPGTAAIAADGTVSVPADGSSPGGVLVVLHDASGNIVSGKTVTVTASSPNAVITPASVITSGSDGAAAFTVTDTIAESLTFTATDTTDGVALSPSTLTFSVPSAASAGITANPPSVPADGQTPATVVVTLMDALNRPTPGKIVSVSNGGGHAVLTGPTPSVTDANGQIAFSATDQVNETVTFTAVDVTDDSLPVPGSASVTYNNSTFTSCNVGVAPVAGAGYAVAPYVTGLPAAPTLFYGNANIGCPGAQNPAFTPSGTVLVSDFLTGNIYQLGLSGGAVSTAVLLNTLTPALGPLVYGKDGNVYATLGNEGAEIVQINPSTGAQVRVVASGLTCPAGLSVDPLSGDLFFDDECTNGGTDNGSIWRIIDPASASPSNPASLVVYATLPNTPNGGMAFAPNGTLYAVSGYYYSQTAQVQQVSPTSASTVSVTPVTGVTSDYAVAIGVTNVDGSAQSLIAEPSGTLTEIPIANPSAAVVLATGSPGVGVTGPDGCLYSARYDTIYRLANSSGSCAFAPTSPAAALKLSPAGVSPNPAQGTSLTVTAAVSHVATASGIPVYFAITGANSQIKEATTNAQGNAVLTYTGVSSGADAITASTTAANGALTSNTVSVNWGAGKDVGFISMNLSPQGAGINQAVNVVASLSDVSTSPAAPVAGQSVIFDLGGASCSATTNGAGNASCSLTPKVAGAITLEASFAGSTQVTAASAKVPFNVSGAPAAAPTVTISVSPTNVAAGASATLSWSSSNASSCTASGAWSGTQPTGGTKTVTPATTGSFTYTLACSGNGGTASASAVLSATLVSVTVTAKSGGGSFNAYLSLCLGLFVLMRWRAATLDRRVRRAGSVMIALLAIIGAQAIGSSARADESGALPGAAWLDPFYVGVRVGAMPVRLHGDDLNSGLAASGFPSVSANTDTSAVGETVYVGFEAAPHADFEFSYTHRDSHVATLEGAVASTASLPALLEDTAGLIRGYGNIFALSFRPRFELAPHLMLDPRVGAFVWSTKVTADAAGSSFSETHQGGGITAGLGVAYRVWRGLEIGVGADFYRGSPHNLATLYGGSLEWRFGR